MTTWQLWKALKSPPTAHPVFQRMLTPGYYDDISWPLLVENMLIQGQIWLWSLVFVLDTRILILMVLSGTFYGLIWASSISGKLALEQHYGMYDLLCLSPAGTVGAAWAICTGCLHRNSAFTHINSQETWSIRIILFIPLIISGNVIFGHLFASTGVMPFIWLGTFLIIFYLDHTQSIILGSLCGVLAPYYAPGRFDTRIWACSAFLAAQAATYLLMFIISGIALPGVYNAFGLSGWQIDLSLPLATIATFYFSRDALMRYLWRALESQWNAAPTELDFMFPRVTTQA